jgi:hypothetical protein
MIYGKGWLNMANRLKVFCRKVVETYTSERSKNGERPITKEAVLNSGYGGSFTITTSSEFDFRFEPGKEYYIDFCKVIASRKSQVGPHAGGALFLEDITGQS